MRVALIRGPLVSPRGSFNNEPTPAVGLAYIAGSLERAGFSVQGIDATAEDLDRTESIPGTRLQYNGIGIPEIIERIDGNPAVIGVSLMFSHEWPYCRELITELKTKHPESVIVAGGEHPTALPEYTLRDCPALDFASLGEGEETMVELCRQVQAGDTPGEVDGLAYIERGAYVQNPPRQRIRAVDQIPWPAWDIFPIEPYLSADISFGPSMGRNMPLLATRGCPYQCTFCSNPLMWTTRYVMRDTDDVVTEIEHYKRQFSITGVQFYDLTAIIKKDWIVDFCTKLAARDLDVEWSLPSGTRSEALDQETLDLMAETGCHYLVYAPESGSEATLKRIKKKVKLSRMEKSVRSAVKAGISLRTNMIIGFPDESRREIFQTLKQQLKFAWLGVNEVPFYIFQPYPGTELYQGLVDRGDVTLNNDYFESLATFTTGVLEPPPRTFCAGVGRRELFAYRLIGMVLGYLLAYTLRPTRILRSLRNVLFGDHTSTVLEQRTKDRLRRLRAGFQRRWFRSRDSGW